MQAFFDSSTPVPIGQDSPEVSVKAPRFTAQSLHLQRDPHIANGNMVYSWNSELAFREIHGLLVKDSTKWEFTPNQSLITLTGSSVVYNWLDDALEKIAAYLNGQLAQANANAAELLAQDQANAYSEAEAVHFAPHFEETPKYPVMDYPQIDVLSEYERATLIQSLRHYFDLLDKHNSPGKEIVMQDVTNLQNKLLASMPIKSPLPTAVTTQLDRMEALLNEIKGAVTIDSHLISGYSMPFIPPVLDDFDQALEDAKAQQAEDDAKGLSS